MPSRNFLAGLGIFLAGATAGNGLLSLATPAQAAATINWEEAVKDPGFRAAVIAVINACIVDNAIIYCE